VSKHDVAMLEGVPGVERVALSVQLSGKANLVEGPGTRQAAQVFAVSDQYFEIDRVQLAYGEIPYGREKRVLLGSRIVRRLFVGSSAIGEYVRIGGVSFMVAGTFAETNEPGKFASNDHAVFLPLAAAATMPGMAEAPGRVIVEVMAGADVEEVGRRVVSRIVSESRGRYSAEDLRAVGKNQLLSNAKSVIASQARTASAVSLLATLIAALGVMNMMFLNTDERRSEIGLRRALGASRREIVAMFVAEAALLCAIGIPVGIIIGRLAAFAVAAVFSLNAVPVMSLGVSLAVAVITTAVVLLFSLAPAWQAARIEPTEALRSE
jgi:putative ABC transport system permease protein